MILDHAPARERYSGQPLWVLVLLIVLVLGAWSAWNAYDDYNQLAEKEYQLLEVRARQREARISGSLRSVDLMLGSIVDDVRDQGALSVAQKNKLLKHYVRLLPEVRNLLVIDASGQIIADATETTIGRDVGERDYFKHHLGAPADDGFYISRPFKTLSGYYGTTLSRVVRDRRGLFAGVVVALIESNFFEDALKLSVSESGVQSYLINSDGDILASAPRADNTGKSVQGGVAFAEHLRSGLATTRHLNTGKLSGVKLMAVWHNFPALPLMVVVNRNLDALMAEWMRTVLSHVAGFVLLAGTALFFTGLAARRQRQLIEAQKQIAAREMELRAIIETEPECVKQLAADGTLLQMNRAGLEMIEADSLEQVVGRKTQQLLLPQYRDAFVALTKRVFTGESGTLIFEITGLRGGHRWLETHAVPLRDSDGQIIALLGVTRDISAKKHLEDEVRQLAFHDPLTQLPNRRLLGDRLNRAMAASRRSGLYAALLFLDLDNFKPLNDVQGHAVGDLLLAEAADRLKKCVREKDTVARVGGDEFVVVLSDLSSERAASAAQASSVAEKIRHVLSQPYLFALEREGQAETRIEHRCTASIGMILFINDESSQDDLLRWADAAMYQAKGAGRNVVRFFDQTPVPSTSQS